MRVETETDVRALRRIALLVRRAREDGGSCAELDGISDVLERMKRNIAHGTAVAGDDLREMVSLARDISCERARTDRLHVAVIDELRDLAGHLRL